MKNKNLFIGRHPAPKAWTHYSINVQPKRIELYCNGIKAIEQDLPVEIIGEKLGSIIFGGGKGGFALDEYVVYDRILSPVEIKALAQGESKISGDMAWYPSLNSFVLDLSCNPKQLKGKIWSFRPLPKPDRKSSARRSPRPGENSSAAATSSC